MQGHLCLSMYRHTKGGEAREFVKKVWKKEPSVLVCALCVCVCVCVILVHMFSLLILY